MRMTFISVAVISALTVVALVGGVLWRVLGMYIDLQTAMERKYLVQSFVVVMAGGLGCLSALVWLGFSTSHVRTYSTNDNSKRRAPNRTRCRRTWMRWFDC
jgi:branched-subunit amino acid ABC-type transport system permease component